MKKIVIESDQYWRRKILGTLRDLDIDYKIYKTQEVKKNLNKKNEYWFICAGGDGRLNKTINFIMKNELSHRVILSYFPTGTANDFSKSAKLERLSLKDCLSLAKKESSDVFLGQVNERYFINCASLGPLTEATRRATAKSKKYFGKVAYFYQYVRQLTSLQTYRAKISEAAGAFEEVTCLALLFANGAYVGGGFKANHHANICQKKLQMISFKRQFLNFRQTQNFEDIEIQLNQKAKINLDGVAYCSDRFRIKVNEKPLRMYLP